MWGTHRTPSLISGSEKAAIWSHALNVCVAEVYLARVTHANERCVGPASSSFFTAWITQHASLTNISHKSIHCNLLWYQIIYYFLKDVKGCVGKFSKHVVQQCRIFEGTCFPFSNECGTVLVATVLRAIRAHNNQVERTSQKPDKCLNKLSLKYNIFQSWCRFSSVI